MDISALQKPDLALQNTIVSDKIFWGDFFFIVKSEQVTKLSTFIKENTHFQRARAKRGFPIVVLVKCHGTMISTVFNIKLIFNMFR